MKKYLVLIALSDGTRAVMHGLFANDWSAIDMGLSMFEGAVSAVPRREAL
ncbi:hypothetical protein [Delftia tsuruhatensis]|nr:hypothetical protein [Delftia tsuruhatensis]